MIEGHGLKRRALMALVFLGVLPLPIGAYELGAYVVTRGLPVGAATGRWLVGQLLLGLAVVVLACAGWFAIWRSTVSLARATDVEAQPANADPMTGERTGQERSMRESVARMLMTIERQASEIERLSNQLQGANEELASMKTCLRGAGAAGLQDRQFFSLRLEGELSRSRRLGHPSSLVIFGFDESEPFDEPEPFDESDAVDGLARPRGTDADDLVREVTEILVKGLRIMDVMCRYDESEFAVLLVETPLHGARAYAQRIIDTLAASRFTRGQRVTVSVGVSACPDGAVTSAALFRGAQEALEAARQAGRNRVALWMGPGVGHVPEAEVALT